MRLRGAPPAGELVGYSYVGDPSGSIIRSIDPAGGIQLPEPETGIKFPKATGKIGTTV